MTDLKIDAENSWVRLKSIWQAVAIASVAVAIYMDIKHRMDNIEMLMERDAKLRSDEREAVVASVNGLRDDMRKVFVDTVTTRQFQEWIERQEITNKEKNQTVIWSKLPR